MAKCRTVTAEEFMRELQADSEYLAMRAAKDAQHAERSERIAADEAPLLAELAQAGVVASSVFDFVGRRPAPSAAHPVLVAHLRLNHHARVREGIIRALGVPTARQLAFEPLRAAYLAEPHAGRWVIANALAGMARLDEVADLPGIEEYSALFT